MFIVLVDEVMTDRTGSSMQEVAACIHRSAEETDNEKCSSTKLLEEDVGTVATGLHSPSRRYTTTQIPLEDGTLISVQSEIEISTIEEQKTSLTPVGPGEIISSQQEVYDLDEENQSHIWPNEPFQIRSGSQEIFELSEIHDTNSSSCNFGNTFVDESILTYQDCDRNNEDFLEQNSMQQTSFENSEEPLVFSQTFKKTVTHYAKQHRSKNKAAKHFGIPAKTIDVWIKKLDKGDPHALPDGWPDEPEEETVYTERFKSSVVDFTKKRRCSVEHAAHTFNLDVDMIKSWRDNANKVKRGAVLMNTKSPQVVHLSLEDIRKKREQEEKKFDSSMDTSNQWEDFSKDFISNVVRYIRRRKCAIEDASMTLQIPADVLRRWSKRVPNSTSKQQKSQSPDLSSQAVSPVSRQPQLASSTENAHKETHRLLTSEYQAFCHLKELVVAHARLTKSSTETSKHFGIPINTVYAWAKQNGIKLEKVSADRNECTPEFMESMRLFVRKRKCSSKYAARLFNINPDGFMPWKNHGAPVSAPKTKITRHPPPSKRPKRDCKKPSKVMDSSFSYYDSNSKAMERRISECDDSDSENCDV